MGQIFGHKFRKRCDQADVPVDNIAKSLEAVLKTLPAAKAAVVLDGDVALANQIRAAFVGISCQESYYIGDICERCGQIVDRPPDPVEDAATDDLLQLVLSRMKDAGPFERAQLRKTIDNLTALLTAKEEPATDVTGRTA